MKTDKSREFKLLNCPFCNFKSKSFLGLKFHVIKSHKKHFHHCPICGKRCKNIVTHARNRAWKCEKHRLLYVLIGCRIKKLEEWKEWAIERLKVSNNHDER